MKTRFYVVKPRERMAIPDRFPFILTQPISDTVTYAESRPSQGPPHVPRASLHRPCLAAAADPAPPPPPFTFEDGDRVVLIGNTLIEREQRSGYWETALTARFPKKNITFRNLGWSGDDVRGIARNSFDGSPAGFNRLRDGVLGLKPTVLIVAYGGNESFDGSAGLPKFIVDYEKLLDALAPTKARLILVAPPRQEKMEPPLP